MERGQLWPAVALTLLAVAALAALFLPPGDEAYGHNTWNGGYRKWPWKADAARVITTLPNTYPHSIETNQLAMDVGMTNETVYATSPSSYYDFRGRWGFGYSLVVRDNDGTYILYAHLDEHSTPPTGSFVAGAPLAISDNSTGGCTNCSTGPHLHFARYSAPPAFDMSDRNIQLSLEPISGHGDGIDTLCLCGYTSDNAGISFDIADGALTPIVAAYQRGGGYNGIGVTANIGDARSPCRNDTVYGNVVALRLQPAVGDKRGGADLLLHRNEQLAPGHHVADRYVIYTRLYNVGRHTASVCPAVERARLGLLDRLSHRRYDLVQQLPVSRSELPAGQRFLVPVHLSGADISFRDSPGHV